jgi:hypothetical protein
MEESLAELEAKLRKLDEEPVVVKVAPPQRPNTTFPKRTPLVVNSPRELVEALGLKVGSKDLSFDAGLLAFAARNPGQAKKTPPDWHQTFWEMGATYTEEEWHEAIRVGEHIANHKYVHTPMAPKPYEPLKLPDFSEPLILPPPPSGSKRRSTVAYAPSTSLIEKLGELPENLPNPVRRKRKAGS